MSKNRFEIANGNINILRDDWKKCAQVTYVDCQVKLTHFFVES